MGYSPLGCKELDTTERLHFLSLPMAGLTIWAFSCSAQFSSVAQSCPNLCDPMNCTMPGLPVHHQLLEFTETHVHQVGDAIQPSHPLSSPSPPAPNPSQHQDLFQWVNSLHKPFRVLHGKNSNEKAREFLRNIYFCVIEYAKASDCVDQNKLWKILKKMGISDHLTCFLRNLYAG